MSVLNAAARKRLKPSQFALGQGRYPINDAAHARNALARSAQNATPAEQATIKAKVHSKFPAIGKGYADGGPVDRLADRVSRMFSSTAERVADKENQAAAPKPAEPKPSQNVAERALEMQRQKEREAGAYASGGPVNIHGIKLHRPVSANSRRGA